MMYLYHFCSCGLLIFNQNNFPSHLQQHLMRAWGRDDLSLTLHHSNSKPQPSNHFPPDQVPPYNFSCSRSRFTQIQFTMGDKKIITTFDSWSIKDFDWTTSL